jgi:uncharacterized membrane protein
MIITQLFRGFCIAACVGITAFAQPIHQRKDISLESIMAKNYPNQFRAMNNKEHYLVIEKTRNVDRQRIHLGENIYFSRTDNVYFEGNLTRLTDSTLTMTYLDETSNRYEVRMFYLNEVERIYKRPKRNKVRWGLHTASFVPLLYDWIWWRQTPFQDPSTLYGVLALGGVNTVIANSDKFFRSKRIGKRNRLRVFQYY